MTNSIPTQAYPVQPGSVYFIGAGPGAPDLITIRSQEIINQADLILYADSLVEASVAELARKPGSRQIGTSGLHLDQIMALMLETAAAGGVVARVHSGDPALYGAIHEQMARLEDANVPYQIVPGVTAAFAAAARLNVELTIPELVQTIILTRVSGRTAVPPAENLRHLAASGASLALYLSVTRMKGVVADLLASGGYTADTPVAVLHKVTWPDESLITGRLGDIVEKVRQAGYTKHALIMVSPALDQRLKSTEQRTASNLYDKDYTHRFRRAESFQRGRIRQNGVMVDPAETAVLAVTRQGSELAHKLAPALDGQAVVPQKFSLNGADSYADSVLTEIRDRWACTRRFVLIMPTGVAVRAIAPLLHRKQTDPAIVCLDEAGRSVISLMGGHQAGANALAQQVAALTHGQAIITTASDVQGKPALDLPPSGWQIASDSAITEVSSRLVNDEPLALYLHPALEPLRETAAAWLGLPTSTSSVGVTPHADTPQIRWTDSLSEANLIITHCQVEAATVQRAIVYHPPALTVGLGCQRDVPATELRQALDTTLAELGLVRESIITLATVDLKAAEQGIHDLAAEFGGALTIVAAERIRATPFEGLSHSAAQAKFDLPGVAEPCALLALERGGRLLAPKRSFDHCTVAVALSVA